MPTRHVTLRNLGLCLLLLFAAVAGCGAAAAEDHVYLFGVVPQYQAAQIGKIWTPILSAMSQDTGLRFELSGSANISSFEKEFLQGKFDFAYTNPYHFIRAHNSQGYIPMVRDELGDLRGILLVPKDSTITDLHQLSGKTVIFPAPNALGASLLLRAYLDQHGIPIVPKYVHSHTSVYLNIALHRFDAGGGVMTTLSIQPQKVQNALRVLLQTEEIRPHPIAAHPRVPEAIREKVREWLLRYGQSEQGAAQLRQIPIARLGPAAFSDYEPLNNLHLEKYYSDD